MSAQDLSPLAILQSTEVFSSVAAPALARLAATARIERSPTRALLVQRGEAPRHLRHVVAGAVELTYSSADGRQSNLPPILAGDWATWLSCFMADPLTYDMWCAPRTVTVAFPIEALRETVGNDPEVLRKMIVLIGRRTRALNEWLLISSLMTAEQRVAQVIITILQLRAGGALDITQEQLSRFGLGSRQRVSRILRALESRGLIATHYGRIIVPSRERLSAFALP